MPINRVIPQEPDEDDLWPDEMSPRADTEEGAHDDLGNETSPNGQPPGEDADSPAEDSPREEAKEEKKEKT